MTNIIDSCVRYPFGALSALVIVTLVAMFIRNVWKGRK